MQIRRAWLPVGYCGSDVDDSDDSDSDGEDHKSLVSGEVRISVHILPEIRSEQLELPVEEDIDGEAAIDVDSARAAGIQRRCVTIECCQYEVAGDFECVRNPA